MAGLIEGNFFWGKVNLAPTRSPFIFQEVGLLENWLTFLMEIKQSAFLFKIIFLKKCTT